MSTTSLSTIRRLNALTVPMFRVALVLVGGYFLALLVSMCLAALLVAFGVARSEAVVSAAMLSFLLYTTLLVAGFAQPSTGKRLWWFGGLPGLLWLVVGLWLGVWA